MEDPERPADPMRSDPGRWCGQHRRYECTKRRKNREVCHGARIEGTAACRMHAGQKSAVAKAKGEAMTAWSAVSGVPVVAATDAVLGMLKMSWARVHLYAALLEQQFADGQDARGIGGDLVELDVEEDYEDDEARIVAVRRVDVGPGAGLVGFARSGVRGIGIFTTGEAIRGLALLEAQERDRCVKFAKVAHDMGIAEHQVKIAEQQGVMLAGAVTRILDALNLSAEQQALVPEVVPGILRAIGEAG